MGERLAIASLIILGCSPAEPKPLLQTRPGESCDAPVSCAQGNYARCRLGNSCRYLASDSSSFDCASCDDCSGAQSLASAWCLTMHGGTSGAPTSGGTSGGTTTGGTTTGSATTGGSTTGGSTTGGSDACGTCFNDATTGACSAQSAACNASTPCTDLWNCVLNCAVGDTNCIMSCESTHNSSTINKYDAVAQCVCVTACASQCASVLPQCAS